MDLKSHRTVEQIAKKHRLDISFVKKQLEMGIPIEHEHTQNRIIATDIALQHLDEIPDYYTRLKKMEASAKKEHKKFRDVKEDAVTDLQRGITELPDASYDSIDNLMRRIMKKRKMSAKQLHNDFVNRHNQTPDTWAKKNMKEETKSGDQGLHDWFDKSKSKDKKPGWVNVVTGGTCASDEPGEGVPKCVSSQRRANMSKEERLSASRRKKAADPRQQEKSGAAKPTNVRTEEMDLQEVKDKPGKGSGKKDACYNKVKSRYDVWPSAYASGALVKCRKVGAANWGTKSEAANLDQQPAIAIKMKKKGIKPKSEMEEDCWDEYKKKGMKKKGNKMVPNCVPIKETMEMKRYCPKCAKEETRDECKYGQKYWDMFSMPITLKHYTPNTPHPGNMPEEKDYEYSMARSELNTIINASKRLKKKIGKGEGNLEAWIQSKITKAADYIDTAADYIDSGESKVNEDVTIEDADGNTFLRIINIIRPERLKTTRGISNRLVGESISSEPKLKPGSGLGGGKPVYEKEKEPKPTGAELPKLPLAKGEGGSPYEPYKAPKEDPKNPYVPAPKRLKVQLAHYEFEGKTLSQFMIEASAAWQRKEGKNPEGGLNKKGISSYRKEHPGSHLSLAVTTKPSKLKAGSKKANRRKSFCSRMSGMKAKLTSAKTANDPNSRINKSLRKWNC